MTRFQLATLISTHKRSGEKLLANGKKPKQVIVAIMRKLLHQIFGILKSGQPNNPAKQGYVGT